eukprot:scaffold142082_cov32-Tisochrysis_lutea.AAC.3
MGADASDDVVWIFAFRRKARDRHIDRRTRLQTLQHPTLERRKRGMGRAACEGRPQEGGAGAFYRHGRNRGARPLPVLVVAQPIVRLRLHQARGQPAAKGFRKAPITAGCRRHVYDDKDPHEGVRVVLSETGISVWGAPDADACCCGRQVTNGAWQHPPLPSRHTTSRTNPIQG